VTSIPSGVSVEGDEFGSAKGASEAEQDQGAIAEISEGCAATANDGQNDVGGRGPLPDRGGADRAPDAREHRLHFLVARGRLKTGSAVEVADGGQPAAQRAGAASGGSLVGQEGAQ
jgi:hypothetical protein